MKKLAKYIFIAFLFFGTEASAFVIPPCPICPSLDFLNDPIEAVKALFKKLRTKIDEIQCAYDEALNLRKSEMNFIGLDVMQSPLKKVADSPVIATSRDIVETKIADIKDAASVSSAYQELFLMLAR